MKLVAICVFLSLIASSVQQCSDESVCIAFRVDPSTTGIVGAGRNFYSAANTAEAAIVATRGTGVNIYDASTACADSSTCGGNSLCQDLQNTDHPELINCTCEDGFKNLNANNTAYFYSCTDIDECNNATLNNCTVNSYCTNLAPGFNCTCNEGYEWNATLANCTDIDECNTTSPCDTNANCTNTIGNYTCVCNSGYVGDGMNCTDVDECTIGTHDCPVNSTCGNTPGSFNCTCNDNDYTYNGTDCVYERLNVNCSFYVTTDDFPFDSDLLNQSSAIYLNLTAEIYNAILPVLSNLDTDAGIFSLDVQFRNSSDGLGDAQAFVTLVINNTIIETNECLININQTTVAYLGLTASANECELAIDGCSSDRRCVDSNFLYCCVHDLQPLLEIVKNQTFIADYLDNTTTNYISNSNPVIAEAVAVFQGLQERDCLDILDLNVTIPMKLNVSVTNVLRALITNATFTLDGLITALNALNSSDTISAGDFDECVDAYSDFRDCHEYANCSNTVGSYTCACNRTYMDNNTDNAGRSCIDPVTTVCEGGRMNVSILTEYYAQLNISLDSLRLADPTCNRSTHSVNTADSIVFSTLFDECNTTFRNGTNDTIVAENAVTNLPASGLFSDFEIKVPFECVMPDSANVSSGYNGTIDTIERPPSSGNSELGLKIFSCRSSAFQEEYSGTKTYGSSDTVYLKIGYSTGTPSGVSIFVTQCFVTATSSQTDGTRRDIISGGCFDNDSGLKQTSMVANGQGAARFQMLFPQFIQSSSIYMHCSVQVCAGTCETTCARRRRRSADVRNDIGKTVVLTFQFTVDVNDPNYSNLISIASTETKLPPVDSNDGKVVDTDLALTITGVVLAFALIVLLALLVVVVVRKRRSRDSHDLVHANKSAIEVNPPSYQ